MNTERRERLIANAAKNAQLTLDAVDYLWKNPETGYEEWKATAYLTERFEALGYTQGDCNLKTPRTSFFNYSNVV